MLNCDVKRIYHSNLIEKLISEPTNYGYTTIIAFIRNNNDKTDRINGIRL